MRAALEDGAVSRRSLGTAIAHASINRFQLTRCASGVRTVSGMLRITRWLRQPVPLRLSQLTPEYGKSLNPTSCVDLSHSAVMAKP